MTLFVFFCAQLLVRAGRFLDIVYSRLPSVDRPGALMGYVSVGAFSTFIVVTSGSVSSLSSPTMLLVLL